MQNITNIVVWDNVSIIIITDCSQHSLLMLRIHNKKTSPFLYKVHVLTYHYKRVIKALLSIS